MSKRSKHGEWKFGELCLRQDSGLELTVHPPKDDEHGWDYLIDLKVPVVDSIPVDLQDHILNCFAQIKTTESGKKAVNLKLTNAIKAVKTPNPFFVFLLAYDRKNDEPSVYGRHIWKTESSEWLKLARTHDLSKIRNLNRTAVKLKFSDKDLIQDSIADWIYSKIKEFGGHQYNARKTQMVEAIGYTDVTAEGTFTLGPVTPEQLALHEVGIVDELPITDFRYHDLRFGIKSPKPIAEIMGSGRVKITPTPRPCTIVLKSKNQETITVPAQIIGTSILGVDHPDSRIRITAGFIDFVLTLREVNQKLNLVYSTTDAKSLPHQYAFLQLVNWSGHGPVKLEVRSDQGRLFRTTVGAGINTEAWMQPMASTLKKVIEIIGSENSREVHASFLDLRHAIRSLEFVSTLSNGSPISFNGVYEGDAPSFRVFCGYVYLELGEWKIGAIYQADVLDIECAFSSMTLHCSPLVMVDSFFLRNSEKSATELAAKFFHDFIDEADEKVGYFLDGDLSKLAQKFRSSENINLIVH